MCVVGVLCSVPLFATLALFDVARSLVLSPVAQLALLLQHRTSACPGERARMSTIPDSPIGVDDLDRENNVVDCFERPVD